MRAIWMASIIAFLAQIGAASAHESWFVRVCPGKTAASKIYLQFWDGRDGFSWSWTSGQTPNERGLPSKFKSASRLYIRGQTVATAAKLQPHAYVCLGFRDHIVQRLEFDDHEDHEKNWNDTDDCAC